MTSEGGKGRRCTGQNLGRTGHTALSSGYSQKPSILSAVLLQATCRVSMITWTVLRSGVDLRKLNTVITVPSSRALLIWLFSYSGRVSTLTMVVIVSHSREKEGAREQRGWKGRIKE